MSTTVISKGFIAALKTAMTEEEREQFWENSHLHHYSINNDGTLVYSDVNQDEPYSQRGFNGDLTIIGLIDNGDVEKFIAGAADHGFILDGNLKPKPYVCVWYNGSDCPITDETYEDFIK